MTRRMTTKQTSAVVSIEEWHVNDCRFLLFPFKHVATLWPVSLLQNFVINLWERLLHCSGIVSGKSQGL